MAVLLLAALSDGQAQPYSLQAPDAETGTRIRPFATYDARYPQNKPYEEFTSDERVLLKAMWEQMPAEDEPPFPRTGMRSILMDIRAAAERRQASGVLSLVAHVAPSGKVTKVDIHASPDDPLTRFAVWRLMTTPFKPAICSGAPCAMQFPLGYEFVIKYR